MGGVRVGDQDPLDVLHDLQSGIQKDGALGTRAHQQQHL